MMNDEKHVIWSNEDLEFDSDFRDDLKDAFPDKSESELVEEMYWQNDLCMDDVKADLNVKLDGKVVVLGDLGTWCGRLKAHRYVDAGTIADLLTRGDYDYETWYVDRNGDLCRKGVHHDGVNYETYRMLNAGVDEEQIDMTLAAEKKSGYKATREAVTSLTSSIGQMIAKVYGWSFDKASA